MLTRLVKAAARYTGRNLPPAGPVRMNPAPFPLVGATAWSVIFEHLQDDQRMCSSLVAGSNRKGLTLGSLLFPRRHPILTSSTRARPFDEPSYQILFPRMLFSHGMSVSLLATYLSATVVLGQQEIDRLPIPLEPPGNLPFEHLQAGTVSQVEAVVQDRYGFMWYGTSSAGLYRDDGYTMRRWVRDPDDPASLSGQGISAIAEDPRGGLWLGMRRSGLDHYDPVTDAFTHFRYDPDDPGSLSSDSVHAVTVDSSGTVWVGTGKGLNRFDPSTGTNIRFRHDPADQSSLSDDAIMSVFVDREGTFWAGSWGLNRYDDATGTFVRYLPEPGILKPTLRVASVSSALISDLTSGPSNWILSIHEDRAGRLWVGTLGGGLYRFDREFDRFGPNEMGRLSDAEAPRRLITSIADDPEGGLWLGSAGGLTWFDPESGSVSLLRHDPSDRYSLSGDLIRQIYQDRQGVMWVSSTFKGLNRHDRAARPFEWITNLELGPFGTYRIHDGPDGTLWVTGGDALNLVDRSTGGRRVLRHVAGDPHSLAPITDIWDVLVEAEGSVWVSGNGIIGYADDGRLDYFRHFRHDPADPESLPAGLARILFLDHSATIWAGTDNFGLSRLDDRERGRFTHFRLGTDFGSLNSIFEDDAGTMWAATHTRGLFRLDPQTGAVTNFDRAPGSPGGITGSTVFGICERSFDPGILWLGVYGGGLNRFDTQSGTATHFTIQNSDIPDNGAQGVLCDTRGHVWVSLDIGLSRYDPETNKFKNFDRDDGLHDMALNAWAYHKSPFSGEMFFGGEHGVSAFFPDDVADNPYPPQVVISGLKLFDKAVPIGADSPLKTLLSETKSFELKHFQNDVTFDFVGLHFSNPAENQYAYMLEPYDEDWRMVGSQQSATFTNLDPGTYTFHVKAANSDGVWNEAGASVQMVILPPWWRTIWAYAIYGLVVLGGIFAVDRTQRQRLIRQERERTRERELAQAREIERQHRELSAAHESLKATQSQLIQSEKLASLGQLTSGIAHELKNPLNFVNNFADMNAELADELSEEIERSRGKTIDEVEHDLIEVVHSIKTNARQIGKHGKRADAIVGSMMAHATAGEGERLEVAVNPFVEEYIRLAHAAFATQNPGFEIKVEEDLGDDVGSIRMAPRELGRALMNILSNGLDALHEYAEKTGEGYEPMLSVSTRRSDDAVEIRIADNGPGIRPDVQKRIFEPFFTTKPAGTGTGLGLSLSYDIVTQGHGGSLDVVSQEGGGATFIVRLPI